MVADRDKVLAERGNREIVVQERDRVCRPVRSHAKIAAGRVHPIDCRRVSLPFDAGIRWD